MFPKVTRTLEEFWSRERRYGYKKITDETKGLCGMHTIWVRTLNPITIFHELIHFLIFRLHGKAMDFDTASVALFLDIMTYLHDCINDSLRYKHWRKNIHIWVEVLKFSVNDWLDWILCR